MKTIYKPLILGICLLFITATMAMAAEVSDDAGVANGLLEGARMTPLECADLAALWIDRREDSDSTSPFERSHRVDPKRCQVTALQMAE